jgi:hypothetical protein
METINLSANDLKTDESGWYVWEGIATDEAVEVHSTVSKLHVLGTVRTEGGFRADGKVAIEGSLSTAGPIQVGGYLVVGADLSAGDSVTVAGDLTVGGYARSAGDIIVDRELRVGSNLTARSVRAPVLLWSAMHLPDVPLDQLDLGMVWPTEAARGYWAARLDMQLQGTRSDLILALTDKLDELLSRTDWTPTERWLIESHQKS